MSKDGTKYKGSIGDSLNPLKNIESWEISDNSLSSSNKRYYLQNCTFPEIASSIEVSLDNKQISTLSEILSLIIKEYEEKI